LANRYLKRPQAFLKVIAGDQLEALYQLAVTTGLRRGDLLGLKRTDLDLERGYMRVERSLDTLYGPPAECDPNRAPPDVARPCSCRPS
jgi:integrase